MAEFKEVMQNMARICKRYWTDGAEECSEDCPLFKTWCFNTENDFPMIDRKREDMTKVEKTVMQWAAEHPAPVYPTWLEWFESVGVADMTVHDHIPADIAEMIGLKSREV